MKKTNPVGFVLLLVLTLNLSGCGSGSISETAGLIPTATPTFLLSPKMASRSTSAPAPTLTNTSFVPTRLPAAAPASPSLTPNPNLPAGMASTLEFVGHLGGRSSTVVGQGNTIYSGIGPELAILDVSDPIHPQRVGYVVLPDVVTDVHIAGDYAYVTAGKHGLHVVDISNPTVPVKLGSAATPKAARSVVVRDNVAYVTTRDAGVGVFDVSEPATPTELFYFGSEGGHIVAAGDYFYVPNRGGLAIVDISDPTDPVEVGSYDLPGPFQDMAVVDSYAYVADSAALRVFDISEATDPNEIGFYATSEYMHAVYSGVGPGCSTTSLVVEGSYVYLDGCDGNQVLDISNPALPTLAGSFDDVAGSMKLAMNGYGYAIGAGGVRVLDLSNPTAPREVGAYQTPVWIWDIAVTDRYAYVADPQEGLRVVDISNPMAPVEVGFYYPPSVGSMGGVAVQGNYVYIVDDLALRVIEVSDPATPVEAGLIETAEMDRFPQESWSLAVVGDYAYAAGRFANATLWVVDVSDPTAPVEVDSSYILPRGAVDISVVDKYAYIVTNDGLEVVDVSDPTAPTHAGAYILPGILWSSVAVADSYAYLGAMYPHDLRVIDISDPTAPVEIARYTPPGDGRAVAVAGSFAYVLDEYRSGVRAVDISDPTTPSRIAFHDLPNPSHFDSIAVANGYIYAGAGEAGLYILRHGFVVE